MDDFNSLFGRMTKKPIAQTQNNGFGIQIPVLPDLAKGLGADDSFFGKATSAYCVASHPELYTYSFLAGAGLTGGGLMVVIGVFAFLGLLRRMLFGRRSSN